MKIETERLLLRPLTEGDLDDFFAYSSESNVGPNAGWAPHKTKEESLGIMQSIFMGREGIFGIVLKESNTLIGTVGLLCDPKRDNPAARMIGYALGEEYWGKGIMTEAVRAVVRYAFDALTVGIISAYCYPHNRRSIGVVEKLGFAYEGRLKQAELLFNGEIADNLCYSLSREIPCKD